MIVCINMKKIVVLDPSIAGISGDMFLSALVSLGANIDKIKVLEDVVPKYAEGVEKLELDFIDVVKRGIKAKSLRIKVEEKHRYRTGREMIEITRNICSNIDLNDNAKNFALRAIEILVEAESSIHGDIDLYTTHMHELSSADTFVDIIGSAIALQTLDLIESHFISLPIAIGGGRIHCTHGLYPVPTPATLEILKKVKAKIVGGPIEQELTTPTGAAIIAGIVKEFTEYIPSIRIESIGYGAGSRDLKDLPNILRIIVGYNDTKFDIEDLASEDIAVIETDIDDVSGEIIGHIFNKLMEVGARDVAIVPLYMKKNRPGYTIRVIADLDKVSEIARILIDELGTLGVRYTRYRRFVVPIREKRIIDVEIKGTKYPVVFKISKDLKGNVLVIKPEYESLKAIAQATGLPLRTIRDLVYRMIKDRGEVYGM